MRTFPNLKGSKNDEEKTHGKKRRVITESRARRSNDEENERPQWAAYKMQRRRKWDESEPVWIRHFFTEFARRYV